MAPPCDRPWTGFELLDHLGDVRPCCWGKLTCGNINEQTPEQIWNGAGFGYYRERMEVGDTDAICKPECPILQGLYRERPGPKREPVESSLKHPSELSPLFLRVVPATTCNLRCPMCYQLSDPPPRLPTSLEQQLTPWLHGAAELVVLGGEPFLAPECLRWIRYGSPDRFPNLRMAAITNGLCFGNAGVRQLLEERQWSWILVSIDAASDDTYARVRGGSYRELLANLSILAEVRSMARPPFEIRFGFVLHRQNLGDVGAFIDLCVEYSAVPQFTCAFGEWHDGTPASPEDFKQFLAAIDRADRRLSQAGFDERLVAGALARLYETAGPAMDLGRDDRPLFYYTQSGAQEMALRLSRAKREAVRGRRQLVVVSDQWQPLPRFAEQVLSEEVGRSVWIADAAGETAPVSQGNKRQGGSRSGVASIAQVTQCHDLASVHACAADVNTEQVAIVGSAEIVAQWGEAAELLGARPLKRLFVSLPFWRQGRAVSALEYLRWVNDVRRFATHVGCEVVGYPDAGEIGLERENQYPAHRKVARAGRVTGGHLSVVAPVLNGAKTLPRFVASLAAQKGAEPFEVVIVDDGSTDESLQILRELIPSGSIGMLTVVSAERNDSYEAGGFNFRAGVARQIGLEYASGRHILFVDSDQELDAECVRQHRYWSLRGFDVVIGDRRFSADAQATAESSYWRWLANSSLHHESAWWSRFYTGNASVSRAALDASGGFDRSLQYWGLDDTDLGYRLWKIGACAWHTARAVVFVDPASPSGGGRTASERRASSWLHMEVMYRKYLEASVLDGFAYLWR